MEEFTDNMRSRLINFVEKYGWQLMFGSVLIIVLCMLLSLSPAIELAGTTGLPNSKLTPGKADTLNIEDLLAKYDGKSYSQAHRKVSESTKRQALERYGLPQNATNIEIDHLAPLCIGGSNSLENIWPQSGAGQWNYHQKDRLETYLCAQMKARKISPEAAYSCIVSSWTKCYTKFIGNSLGGADYDNEDEVIEAEQVSGASVQIKTQVTVVE